MSVAFAAGLALVAAGLLAFLALLAAARALRDRMPPPMTGQSARRAILCGRDGAHANLLPGAPNGRRLFPRWVPMCPPRCSGGAHGRSPLSVRARVSACSQGLVIGESTL
jgi:hypothetical protein